MSSPYMAKNVLNSSSVHLLTVNGRLSDVEVAFILKSRVRGPGEGEPLTHQL